MNLHDDTNTHIHIVDIHIQQGNDTHARTNTHNIHSIIQATQSRGEERRGEERKRRSEEEAEERKG